jgi:hypothetical protein
VQTCCVQDGVVVCLLDHAEVITLVLRMWLTDIYAEDGDEPDEQRPWDYLSGDKFCNRSEALRRMADGTRPDVESNASPRDAHPSTVVGCSQYPGDLCSQHRGRNQVPHLREQ